MKPFGGVNWADHAFEEGVLYVRIRFTDNTELCWRITSSTLLEETDLSDWKNRKLPANLRLC